MAGYTDAEVICYVTMNPRTAGAGAHPPAARLRARGGRERPDDHAVRPGRHIPLLWTHLIPRRSRAARCTTCRTRCSPRSWRTRWASSSTRSGPGDRRDEDLREIAAAVAGRFDHYIARRDDGLRGRDGDEVPRIIARRCRSAVSPRMRFHVIPDEQQAVDAALQHGRAGRPRARVRRRADADVEADHPLQARWRHARRRRAAWKCPRSTPPSTSNWSRRWKAWCATNAACASSARKRLSLLAWAMPS